MGRGSLKKHGSRESPPSDEFNVFLPPVCPNGSAHSSYLVDNLTRWVESHLIYQVLTRLRYRKQVQYRDNGKEHDVKFTLPLSFQQGNYCPIQMYSESNQYISKMMLLSQKYIYPELLSQQFISKIMKIYVNVIGEF